MSIEVKNVAQDTNGLEISINGQVIESISSHSSNGKYELEEAEYLLYTLSELLSVYMTKSDGQPREELAVGVTAFFQFIQDKIKIGRLLMSEITEKSETH